MALIRVSIVYSCHISAVMPLKLFSHARIKIYSLQVQKNRALDKSFCAPTEPKLSMKTIQGSLAKP